MVGILVHGDNHFVVRGPLPDRATAIALKRWSIITQEFRENLEWAVMMPADGETSPAVTQLLDELAARGVAIHNSGVSAW